MMVGHDNGELSHDTGALKKLVEMLEYSLAEADELREVVDKVKKRSGNQVNF